ncbi:MAG: phage tail protein [Candidatus Hydrogenedentes bacterium]|nr:phage tail protein [Candidatus Hydrogenedentota bacterium]
MGGVPLMNSCLLNTATLNGVCEAASAQAQHAVLRYRMEVRSRTGTLLAYLPEFYGGTWERRVNQAGQLRFVYDATAEQAQYLTTSNQIWLRDERGQLLEEFTIQDAIPGRSGARVEVEVEGESLLARLSDEWIASYEETATVREHIVEWLKTHQAGTPKIYPGTIASAWSGESRAMAVGGQSMRKAIDDLFDTVGDGYIYVEPSSRRFCWKTRIGRDTGQQVRYRKNMTSIKRRESRRDMFTRLYLYGDAGLNLIDAGESNEYIQQNTGTYGIVSRGFTRKEIKTPATLLLCAQEMIDIYSVPRTSYEIDLVDLSQSNDGYDFDFDRIDLGSTLTVIDEVLGIDVETIVERVVYDLDNPLSVKVELGMKVPELSDYLDSLEDRIRALENATAEPPLELSSTEPPAVGVGTAGVATTAARSDHSHDIDDDVVYDIVEDAIAADTGVQTALEDFIDSIGGGGAAPSDATPQAIILTPAAGTSADYARADHVHLGIQLVTAASKAELPTEGLDETAIGRVTGGSEEGRMYCRNAANDGWDALNFLE